jgi:hypothetical protein
MPLQDGTVYLMKDAVDRHRSPWWRPLVDSIAVDSRNTLVNVGLEH